MVWYWYGMVLVTVWYDTVSVSVWYGHGHGMVIIRSISKNGDHEDATRMPLLYQCPTAMTDTAPYRTLLFRHCALQAGGLQGDAVRTMYCHATLMLYTIIYVYICIYIIVALFMYCTTLDTYIYLYTYATLLHLLTHITHYATIQHTTTLHALYTRLCYVTTIHCTNPILHYCQVAMRCSTTTVEDTTLRYTTLHHTTPHHTTLRCKVLVLRTL